MGGGLHPRNLHVYEKRVKQLLWPENISMALDVYLYQTFTTLAL